MFYRQSKKEKELLKFYNIDIRGVKKSDVFRFLDKNVLPSLETMQHDGYCDFEPLKIYYGIDIDGKEYKISLRCLKHWERVLKKWCNKNDFQYKYLTVYDTCIIFCPLLKTNEIIIRFRQKTHKSILKKYFKIFLKRNG